MRNDEKNGGICVFFENIQTMDLRRIYMHFYV